MKNINIYLTISFLSLCYIKQVCGNHLILIDESVNSVYECNTITLDCSYINYARLTLLRETTTCSKMQLINPVTNTKCTR